MRLPETDLAVECVNRPRPVLFEYPVLDYTLVVTNDGCVEEQHVRPPVTLYEFIDSVPVKVCLLKHGTLRLHLSTE